MLGPVLPDRVSCLTTGCGAGMARCTRDKVQCARNVHAVCTRQTCDSALCCVLFGLLFMDTVKKKYKNDPRELGRHILNRIW